jgi:hypothetical protein
MSDHHDHELNELRRAEAEFWRELTKILKEFFPTSRPAVGFKITQIQGDSPMPTNNSIVAGTFGTFGEVPVDGSGNPDPQGEKVGDVPVWSADDTQVGLTPSLDGTSCNAAVPAADLQGTAPAGSPGSFNLKVSGFDSNGNPISSTLNVLILPPVVTVTPAVGFKISQSA